MTQREQRHVVGWLPELLVLVLLASAVATTRFDLGARWLGWDDGSQGDDPAKVLPPPGLDLPKVGTAAAIAQPLDGGAVSDAAVAAALRPFVDRPKLGPHVGVLVTQVSDGRVVYRHGATSVTPASTMKLLTSAAALESLGPMRRFRTSVTSVPPGQSGQGTSRITLVGGGDPFLASKPTTGSTYPHRADLVTLARQTAAKLRAEGRQRVRLDYDASLFTGPSSSPSWPDDYLTDAVVPPISALWADEGHRAGGHGYVDDPALAAARMFRKALTSQGITVVGRPRSHTAAPNAQELAAVESAPLGEIVQRVLDVSDNNAAEVLAHQVGIAEKKGGSFAGGASAVPAVLDRLGVQTQGTRIFDGSGLSRHDVLTTQTIVDVLRVAASDEHPELRQVVTGLPVAGYTGSLANRFDTGALAGRGRVHAKTGTLTGVHGLAGIATDVEGNQLAFVMVADRVKVENTLPARAIVDRMAAALGACACSA